MLRLVALISTVCAAAMAMTTSDPMAGTSMASADKILYDFKHHKAMIVRGDGCYEYHMNHQDVEDAKNDATKAVLEARMIQELSMAINIQESGHHHIDHMTQEIKTACANIPVYQWDTPAGP